MYLTRRFLQMLFLLRVNNDDNGKKAVCGWGNKSTIALLRLFRSQKLTVETSIELVKVFNAFIISLTVEKP